MTVAARAVNFGASAAVAVVGLLAHVLTGERLQEAGPAGTGGELRIRRKQRQPTAGTCIDALFLVVEQRATERTLGIAAAENAVLLWRKAAAPLVFAERELRHFDRSNELACLIEYAYLNHWFLLLLSIPNHQALQLFHLRQELHAPPLSAAGKWCIPLRAIEGRDDIRHMLRSRRCTRRSPAQQPQTDRIHQREHPDALHNRPTTAISQRLRPRYGRRLDQSRQRLINGRIEHTQRLLELLERGFWKRRMHGWQSPAAPNEFPCRENQPPALAPIWPNHIAGKQPQRFHDRLPE